MAKYEDLLIAYGKSEQIYDQIVDLQDQQSQDGKDWLFNPALREALKKARAAMRDFDDELWRDISVMNRGENS